MPLKLISLASLLIVLPFYVSGSEPWGKDADLALKDRKTASAPIKTCSTPLLGIFGEIMIKFHQQVVSPIDGPRSHFRPSSSQYALDAMRKYGFFVGVMKGCDRLMRENKEEWVYRWTVDESGNPIKFDPVR